MAWGSTTKDKDSGNAPVRAGDAVRVCVYSQTAGASTVYETAGRTFDVSSEFSAVSTIDAWLYGSAHADSIGAQANAVIPSNLEAVAVTLRSLTNLAAELANASNVTSGAKLCIRVVGTSAANIP